MNRALRVPLNVAVAAIVVGLLPDALAQGRGPAASSLLLLFDASGSMGDPVGGGNPEVRIEAAKGAAAALSRAASGGSRRGRGAGLQR